MIQEHKYIRSRGFTLVELSLAMAFISMLLLAIAFLTIQMSAIYNKGLTIRSVNEAGQVVSSDIQRTLNSSRVSYVKMVTDGNGDISDPENTAATGGRLCADLRVYAWNYAKALKEGTGTNPNSASFNKYASGTGDAIRLIRFTPSATSTTDYCQKMVGGAYPPIPSGSSVDITNLLTAGDVDLAISNFTINKDSSGRVGQAVADDPQQRIFNMSLVIGTSEDSILTGNAAGCQAPKSSIDDQYCAVNQFDFTARAGTN